MSKVPQQTRTPRLSSNARMVEAAVPLPSAVRQLQLGVRGIRGSGNSYDETKAPLLERSLQIIRLIPTSSGHTRRSLRRAKLLRGIFFSLAAILILPAILFAQDANPGSKDNFASLENGLIHFGDIVAVDVAGVRDFDWRGTVTPEGFLEGYEISGENFFALCQSPTEIAAEIAAKLSRLVKNPQVTVSIVDRSGRPTVILSGAVKTPQRFQLRRSVTLRELIVIAGGISDSASGEIQIFRPDKAGCSASRIQNSVESAKKRAVGEFIDVSVFDIIAGRSGSELEILSGDIITVEEALPIFVLGGVASPRRVSTTSEMTVSRAIAAAGGLSKNADSATVRIFRRKSGVGSVVEVDLEKIKAGVAPDTPLTGYDVVEVAERGGKKSEGRPYLNLDEGRPKNTSLLPLRVLE